MFERPLSQLANHVLRIYAILGLTKITVHPASGFILEATNLTILNFFLVRLGPMSEKRLVRVLMCSQVSGRATLIDLRVDAIFCVRLQEA